MSIVCPRCKNRNRQNALYCSACGAELGAASASKTALGAGNWQPWDASNPPSSPGVSSLPGSSGPLDPASSPAGSGPPATPASGRSASASPARPAKRKAKASRGVEGIVRSLAPRVERSAGNSYETTVLYFTLERLDETTGNRLPPVPVEMRGVRFAGYVSEGDRVRIAGRWKSGEVLHPKKIMNLTTNAEVKSLGVLHLLLKQILVIMFLLILAGVVFMLIKTVTQ